MSQEIYNLTKGVSEGDPLAFEKFYETYFDRLYKKLLVITAGDEELTKDVLQETMLKIIRNLKPTKTELELWVWITKIARHTLIDLQRKNQRSRKRELSFFEMKEEENQESNIAILEALEIALAKLGDAERALINAFYFERATYQQIAGNFNITERAVEGRLARIRKRLKESLLEFLSDV